ncbi:PQQ-binding-like beta-propeller repeat protein [Rhodococcus sp. NPDC079359]|uniref:outer membrane protein assembly factor BamB family protein n=1 Tax=Rhodococcus sp. NPDC079359 TaxID=3154961 RepID=UPI00344FC3C6
MPEKQTWALVAAATAAVVTIVGAGAVLVGQTPTSTMKIIGTNDRTPGLAWSLSAADYLGRPWAQFFDPRGGVMFPDGSSAAISVGDTLVVAAGVNRDGYSLEDPVMLGIDASDGTVRWQHPATGIEQCASESFDGKIVCYASGDAYEIVTYEAASGNVVRTPVEESVFALTVADDTLYVVEGNAEDYDVRVHAGTPDDISSRWVQQYEAGGAWEEVFSGAFLTVADGVGLVGTAWQGATFDAETGAELFGGDPNECVTSSTLVAGPAVAQTHVDCETYDTITEVLRRPDGRIVATDVTGVPQTPRLYEPAAEGVPVVIGSSGYDTSTGEKLWTNPDLLGDFDGTRYPTLVAVVGTTAYVEDSTTDVALGIDLRTGSEMWRRDLAGSFIPSGHSGTTIAGDDGRAIVAVDIETGNRLWEAPFEAIDTDPDLYWSGTTTPTDIGWMHVSPDRMLGLTPLD